MTQIRAPLFNNGSSGLEVPSSWLRYTCNLADQMLWAHYFLWEAYQVVELVGEDRLRQMRILEPGCGHGVVGCLLSLMGADVTFLDYDDDALSQARKSARDLGVEARIEFVKGDIFSMPLPPHSYDLVWNDGVIEHFEQPVQIVKIMAQMAKPGGQVLVTVPNRWTLHSFLIRPFRRWRKSFAADRWGREKSYSERQLKSLMGEAGLANLRTSTHHLQRALLDDYLFLHPLPQAFAPLAVRLMNIVDALEVKLPLLSKLGFMVAGIGEAPVSDENRRFRVH